MHKKRSARRRGERRGRGDLHSLEYGSFIVLNLLKIPLTKDQILEKLSRVGAHFGIRTPKVGTPAHNKMLKAVDYDLGRLSEMGLVLVDEQGSYHLTERGREEASKTERGLEKFASRIRAFTSSAETTSKVSLVVNVLLAALKLGVGLLFNSVALLADGFDNLIDVLSATAVFFGIKYKRELYSTAFIIVMMLGTAVWIGYESITRIIRPEVVDTGALIIAAAVFSGALCYLMSVYQHLVGKRAGSLSLVSQSIDSRNHVIYAVAVLVGIIFARFGIFIVDSLVGLAVAIVILKSAYDLTTEVFKMAKGGELNLSSFGREYEKVIDKHRKGYFRSWTLLSLRDVHSKEDIVSRFNSSFATEDLPVVSHFGFSLWQGFDLENQLDSLLEELSDEGLMTVADGEYRLTAKGRSALNKKLWYQRFVEP
jgi:hypothetical protein